MRRSLTPLMSGLALITASLFAGASSAATISYAYDAISLALDSSSAPSGPDAEISATFLFPQFDPSSGTLTSIDLAMSGDLRFEFGGTSNGMGETARIAGFYGYSANVNGDRLGGIQIAISDQCYSAYPTTCSAGGVRGRVISEARNVSTEFDSFIGGGTVDYDVWFGFEFFNLTNMATAGGLLTSDNLSFEITYNYEELPAVPLPASGLLLGAAVLTLLRRKPRVQSRS